MRSVLTRLAPQPNDYGFAEKKPEVSRLWPGFAFVSSETRPNTTTSLRLFMTISLSVSVLNYIGPALDATNM